MAQRAQHVARQLRELVPKGRRDRAVVSRNSGPAARHPTRRPSTRRPQAASAGAARARSLRIGRTASSRGAIAFSALATGGPGAAPAHDGSRRRRPDPASVARGAGARGGDRGRMAYSHAAVLPTRAHAAASVDGAGLLAGCAPRPWASRPSPPGTPSPRSTPRARRRRPRPARADSSIWTASARSRRSRARRSASRGPRAS